MPEGDSIHRVAGVLRPLLVGTALRGVRIEGVVRAELEGATVTAVTPLGKHMMIDVDRGWQVRVHLGMYGRWRRYRAPRTAPAAASLVLITATDEITCLRARDVELTARRDPRRSRAVAALGPDLLADDFDPAVAAARARTTGATPIGVVLLDQRVAAGIGNVYKSELCFLERLSPFLPSREVSDDKLGALYGRARELMKDNLDSGGWRITTTRPAHATGFSAERSIPTEQRHWVYRRVRRPCHVCGTLIRSRLQGKTARMTYWCPSCQR